MAFYTKEERIPTYLGSPNLIGPGAYIYPNKPEVQESYAPFLSTTLRDTMKVQNSSPGPGSYFNPEWSSYYLQGYKQPSKASHMFASHIKRIPHKEPEDAPGPGTYETSPKSRKRLKTNVKPSKLPKLTKNYSFPSIPVRSNGEGYDELPNGELVPHKNSDKNLDESSIGPGHYNPIFSNENSANLGTEWYKYSSKRNMFVNHSNSTPGPGSYLYKNKLFEDANKHKSAFTSKVRRDCYIPERSKSQELSEDDIEEELESIPGPGYYFNQDSYTSFPKKTLPRMFQYFGSRCVRFKSQNIKKEESRKYYDKKVITKPAKKNPPFDTNSKRFNYEIEISPGPGSYNDDVNLGYTKIDNTQGAFGSTEKRFIEANSHDLPGPGAYSVELAAKSKQSKSTLSKLSPSFASRVKRESFGPDFETPPPGQYKINDLWSKKISQNSSPKLIKSVGDKNVSIGFNSKMERFKATKDATIGPGFYDPDCMLLYNGSRVMISKGNRFDYKVREELPGPGHYDDAITDKAWNRQSFNVNYIN